MREGCSGSNRSGIKYTSPGSRCWANSRCNSGKIAKDSGSLYLENEFRDTTKRWPGSGLGVAWFSDALAGVEFGQGGKDNQGVATPDGFAGTNLARAQL